MFPNKTTWVLVSTVILAGGSCPRAFAQSSEPPERPKRTYNPDVYFPSTHSINGKVIVLPIGTTFEGRVDKTISSEHSREGERFNVVIDSPVMVNGTDVVIPPGSQVVGEVVEAVPAADVPRQPWEKKPLVHGKLRIQLSSLRTPDGATYPLIANIAGEVFDGAHKYLEQYRQPLGTNVGYVGTQAGFDASNVNRIQQEINRKYHGDMGPQVMAKKEFLKDEVSGMGPDGLRNAYDFGHPRSLVLKKRDYYIYKGSPLTIKLTAPFKIGMVDPGQGVAVGSLGDEPRERVLPPPTTQPPPALPGAQYGDGGMQRTFPQPQPQPQAQPQQGQGAAIPPDSF